MATRAEVLAGRLGRWLRRRTWWLRPLLRPICWWRGRHRGYWGGGAWICNRCAATVKAAPPVGAMLTDEGARVIYQVGRSGELRRLDKIKGGKKARRRQRGAVQAARALRAEMLGTNERGRR